MEFFFGIDNARIQLRLDTFIVSHFLAKIIIVVPIGVIRRYIFLWDVGPKAFDDFMQYRQPGGEISVNAFRPSGWLGIQAGKGRENSGTKFIGCIGTSLAGEELIDTGKNYAYGKQHQRPQGYLVEVCCYLVGKFIHIFGSSCLILCKRASSPGPTPQFQVHRSSAPIWWARVTCRTWGDVPGAMSPD